MRLINNIKHTLFISFISILGLVHWYILTTFLSDNRLSVWFLQEYREYVAQESWRQSDATRFHRRLKKAKPVNSCSFSGVDKHRKRFVFVNASRLINRRHFGKTNKSFYLDAFPRWRIRCFVATDNPLFQKNELIRHWPGFIGLS